MRKGTCGAMFALVGMTLAIASAPAASDAASPGATAQRDRQGRTPAVHHVRQHAGPATKATARRASLRSGPILQCVTFARDASGVHLAGNAHTWWANAAGLFARGHRPERGAILNFRASGGMRLGHVAVVSRVVSAREILIDHANWAGPGERKGQVRRSVSVIDASPDNDWTAVQVANGIGSWGRIYPTYGFIYPRAAHGVPAERIEIAADRDVAVPAHTRRAAAAVPAGRAGAPIATSPWVWVDGRAVARD